MEITYNEYVCKNADHGEVHDLIGSIRERYSDENCGISTVLGLFMEEDGDLYTEKLERLAEDMDSSKPGNLSINSFPFGIKTDQVFPEFVGIYYANNKYDKTLRDVLNSAKSYCGKVGSSNNPASMVKKVLILTEKWDSYMFRRYFAASFINYANKYNICFIFLLVTDFGVVKIPFLNLGRDGRRGNIHVSHFDSYARKDVLLELKKFSPVRYASSGCALIGCRDAFEFIIDFTKDEYCFKSPERYIRFPFRAVNVETGKISDIPDRVIRNFVLSVAGLINIPGQKMVQDVSSMDAETKSADIFGKHFEWYFNNEDPFNYMENAFELLLKELRLK